FWATATCSVDSFDLIADPAFGAGVLTAFGANKSCRVLIALNATIPETATMCRTKTISNARDNFMFGSDMSSYVSADARSERRATVARSFFRERSFGIFIFMRGAPRPHRGKQLRAGLARARDVDRRDRHSF